MKYLKVILPTFLALLFVVATVTTSFACPMMMNDMPMQEATEHCDEMMKQETKDITEQHNCDTCQCSNCVQIPLALLNTKQSNLQPTKSVISSEKSFTEFSLSMLSPPPKLS